MLNQFGFQIFVDARIQFRIELLCGTFVSGWANADFIRDNRVPGAGLGYGLGAGLVVVRTNIATESDDVLGTILAYVHAVQASSIQCVTDILGNIRSF